MGTPTLQKQPSESRLYDFDFSANLDSAEVIQSITSVILTPVTTPPLVESEEAVSTTGKIVQFRLSGGLDGTSYKLTVKVHTSLNNDLEGEGILNVFDR